MTYTRETYDEVVGYDADGNAIILNYTFSDLNFHGATGAIVAIISDEEYAAETTQEAMEEYFEDLWREEAGRAYGTELGLSEWVSQNWYGLVECRWDRSCGQPLDAGVTDCIGGGRIFPGALDDLVTVLRPDLVEIIRKAEAGN